MSDSIHDRILAIVAHAAAGLSKTEVHAALKEAVSYRTLERRLTELVDAKKLVTLGKARALRYKISTGVTTVGEPLWMAACVNGVAGRV